MTDTILEFNDVSMQFGEGDARVDAWKNINFHVNAGEVVALLGPSGSGKSTLLSIAGALLTPSKGRLILDGDDIAQIPSGKRTEIRLERIGFIFQGSNLISYLTGREQLMFIATLIDLPGHEAEQRANRLLEELGMAKRADHYPEEMSGGERQRIAIARALMNNPRIILADEPTASLDSARGRQVVEMLRDEVHSSERAGVLVTHDERLIDLCDRVLRIEDGAITVDAPSTHVAASGEGEKVSSSLRDKMLHR